MRELITILRTKGLKNKELLEEFNDHYLTQYENLIVEGKTTEQAESIVKKQLAEINFKSLNRNHFFLHHKYKIMISFILTIAGSFFFYSQVQEPPSTLPLKVGIENIASGFGERMHPISFEKKFHNGIDIKAKIGTPVVAPSAGIITDCGFQEKLGYYIEIRHDEIFSTRYHHLSKINVEKDSKVLIGDKIGEVGSTGMSTAPHLHYEVIKNGKNVDPSDYIRA